jgi:DNA repair exonuclease SbcCD nuclease subunit
MSKWNLLATADLHFGNNHGAGTVNKRGINSFLYVRELVFSEMIKRAAKEKCPIVVAGDTLDSPSVDPATATSFHKCLKLATELGVSIVFVAGNHESNGMHNIIESYSRLGLENLRFLDAPDILTINKISLYCVPYTERSPDEEYNIVRRYISIAMRSIDETYKVLVLHYPIIGCKYDSGSTVTTGFNLASLLAAEGNPFDFIIAGDFHDRQGLTGVKNFLYLGQPYWSDFASVGKKRGYTLFNFTTGKRKLVQPKSCPRFRVLKNIIKASDIKDDLNNTIVKVHISRDTDAAKIYEQCYKLGAIKVMLRRDPSKDIIDTEVTYKFDDNRRDAIASFAMQYKKHKPKGVGLKLLIRTGLRAFKEASI